MLLYVVTVDIIIDDDDDDRHPHHHHHPHPHPGDDDGGSQGQGLCSFLPHLLWCWTSHRKHLEALAQHLDHEGHILQRLTRNQWHCSGATSGNPSWGSGEGSHKSSEICTWKRITNKKGWLLQLFPPQFSRFQQFMSQQNWNGAGGWYWDRLKSYRLNGCHVDPVGPLGCFRPVVSADLKHMS